MARTGIAVAGAAEAQHPHPVGHFDSTGDVPQVFLSGNADFFPRTYPGWSATCVSQTDSDPTSQFAVAAGNLTTADSDPFGSPVGA